MIPDEIHDLLRWDDWRALLEFKHDPDLAGIRQFDQHYFTTFAYSSRSSAGTVPCNSSRLKKNVSIQGG
jgi:hypothetical protein